MTISDEMLMAFADGELDPAAAAAVEAALHDDPRLAAQVAEHRALRARVQAAFSEELDEPVPRRLIDTATRAVPAAVDAPKIVPIDAARTRRERSRWRAPLPLAMAASLAFGITIGFLAWHSPVPLLGENAQGALVADGGLARALSDQLAGPGGGGRRRHRSQLRQQIGQLLPDLPDCEGARTGGARVPQWQGLAHRRADTIGHRSGRADGVSHGRLEPAAGRTRGRSVADRRSTARSSRRDRRAPTRLADAGALGCGQRRGGSVFGRPGSIDAPECKSVTCEKPATDECAPLRWRSECHTRRYSFAIEETDSAATVWGAN